MSEIAGGVTPVDAANGLGVGYGRVEIDVLQWAAHNERFGWNMCTTRRIRKRDADRLVTKGLLADGGMAVKVDGDGFPLEPERYGPSYVLTDAGRDACKRIAAQQKAGWDAMSANDPAEVGDE